MFPGSKAGPKGPVPLPGSIFLPVPVILKTSYVSFLKRMYYNGLRTQERGLTLE